MHRCAVCHHPLLIARLDCGGCAISYRGEFGWPRLARMSVEHQDLAEQLLLAGGNLKAVAETVGVSYPTLKKRLEGLRAELERLRRGDLQASDADLQAVERGTLTPEQAARRIRERNGGA